MPATDVSLKPILDKVQIYISPQIFFVDKVLIFISPQVLFLYEVQISISRSSF